ncbi:MAG: SPOR domain-containing protein, partial [Pseudomonadota bacterium]|nr:SPOR domain-containing protein [Pseudomonadota bacterium]
PQADPGQPAMLALANHPSVDMLAAQEVGELDPLTDEPQTDFAFAEELAPVAASEGTVDDSDVALADAGFASAQGAIRYVSSEVVQKTPARTHQPVAPRIAGTAVPQRVAANTGASGDYNVQLGSYFSMSDANEAWKQFQKRYPEMGDAERVITKARVNGKIYYRVAAAGFAKSSAQTLCRSVKGKGGGCIAYASSRPLPGAIDVVDTGMRVAAR